MLILSFGEIPRHAPRQGNIIGSALSLCLFVCERKCASADVVPPLARAFVGFVAFGVDNVMQCKLPSQARRAPDHLQMMNERNIFIWTAAAVGCAPRRMLRAKRMIVFARTFARAAHYTIIAVRRGKMDSFLSKSENNGKHDKLSAQLQRVIMCLLMNDLYLHIDFGAICAPTERWREHFTQDRAHRVSRG